MKPFTYARPGTPEELFDLRVARSKVQHGDVPPVVLKGGGMDLLDLAKNGVSTPATMVDLRGV